MSCMYVVCGSVQTVWINKEMFGYPIGQCTIPTLNLGIDSFINQIHQYVCIETNQFIRMLSRLKTSQFWNIASEVYSNIYHTLLRQWWQSSRHHCDWLVCKLKSPLQKNHNRLIGPNPLTPYFLEILERPFEALSMCWMYWFIYICILVYRNTTKLSSFQINIQI